MRAYSEIIASFRRGGPFPIEADYIFETEAKLKEFYSSPEENAILHKGLLKVVENDGDGNQALYWVTRKETNDELEFTKLITSKSDETIADLITRLEQEIKDRKTADDAIWGSVDHTSVPEDLNSLKDIAEEITSLKIHRRFILMERSTLFLILTKAKLLHWRVLWQLYRLPRPSLKFLTVLMLQSLLLMTELLNSTKALM